MRTRTHARAISLALAFVGCGCGDTTPSAPPWRVEVSVAEGASWCSATGDACAPAAPGPHAPAALLRTNADGRALAALDDETQIELGPDSAIALLEGTPRLVELRAGVVTVTHEARAAVGADGGARHASLALRVADHTGDFDGAGQTLALVRVRPGGERAAVTLEHGALAFHEGAEVVTLRTGETGALVRGHAVDRRAGYAGEIARVERPLAEERAPTSAPRGLGTMTARVPGTQEIVAGVHLASHHVRALVQRGFARTEVEEVFENETDRTLEGRYVFAVPPRAVTARLALWVGDELVEDEMVERARAAELFKAIVDDTVRPRDPALLEWVASGELSLKVFPIPPKGSRKVVLAYDESLPVTAGEVRYVYPLSLGAERANTIGDLSISVTAEDPDGAPEDVATPRYPAKLERADKKVTASFAAKGYAPASDFVLAWRQARQSPADAAAFVPAWGAASELGLDRTARAAGDQSYFALRLVATLPKDAPAPAYRKRDRAIALDTSFSQSKETLAASARLALAAARELDPDERFALLACDSACRSFPDDGLADATVASFAAAQKWLGSLAPAGSSDVAGALVQAASRLTDGARGQLVYIGDGAATSGELTPAHVAGRAQAILEKKKADVRLVASGVTVDAAALAAIARELGATMQPLVTGDPLARRIERIAGSLRMPVVRAPHVELPSTLSDVYPRALPSLVLGDEVLLVGKLDKLEDGVAKLTGDLEGSAWATEAPIAWGAGAERQATIVPRLWAAQKIDDLVASGDPAAKKDVVELSKRFHVLSRYTSMLVLENDAMFSAMGIARTLPGAPSLVGPNGNAVPLALAAELSQAQLSSLGALGSGNPGVLSNPSGSAPLANAGGGLADLGQPSGASEAKVAGPVGNANIGGVAVSGGAVANAARVIAGARAGVRRCFNKALQEDPDMSGTLRVTLRVGPSGEVTAVSPSSSGHLSGSLLACVVSRMRNLQFDPPEGGGATLVVPFTFVHQDPPPRQSDERPPTFAPQSVPSASSRVSDDAWRTEGEDALAKLRAAVEKEPKSRQRLEALVRGLLARGRFDEAKTTAQSFAEADPDVPIARELLSYAAAASGDSRGALASVDAAVETAPLVPKSHLRAARAFEAAGDETRACAHWRSLAELEPASDAYRSEALRCRARTMGERDAALAEARTVDKPGPRLTALLPLLESATMPAFDAATSAPGQMEITVTCERGVTDCPIPLVVAPNGTVFSPLTPADARSSSRGVALTVVRDGTYRTLLAGGAPDAKGEVTVRAAGTTQKFPFSRGGLQSLAVTQVSVPQLWYPTLGSLARMGW